MRREPTSFSSKTLHWLDLQVFTTRTREIRGKTKNASAWDWGSDETSMTLAYHGHEWSLLNNVRDSTGIFLCVWDIFILLYFLFLIFIAKILVFSRERSKNNFLVSFSSFHLCRFSLRRYSAHRVILFKKQRENVANLHNFSISLKNSRERLQLENSIYDCLISDKKRVTNFYFVFQFVCLLYLIEPAPERAKRSSIVERVHRNEISSDMTWILTWKFYD